MTVEKRLVELVQENLASLTPRDDEDELHEIKSVILAGEGVGLAEVQEIVMTLVKKG